MQDFQPELGQAIFGQPSHQFDVPMIMDAVLNYISEELSRVRGNMEQDTPDDPFCNSGPSGNYESEVFSVHAYDWGDDDQPWNFKCGDVEISWYKYCGRGMSSNVEITPKLANEILTKCVIDVQNLEVWG